MATPRNRSRGAGVDSVPRVGSRHFRAGVVTVVRRGDGRVLAFERVDAPGEWQLPQGGLEKGEAPVEAAWRELGEETGSRPGRRRADRRAPRVGAVRVARRRRRRQGAARSGAPLVHVPHASTSRRSRRRTAASSGRGSGSSVAWLIDQVVPFRRGRLRAGSAIVSGDLFSAAADERLRSQAPLAARHAAADDRRRGRAAPAARTGSPAAPAGRAGPPVVGPAVGPARHREDDARPGRRRDHGAGVRAAVGRDRRASRTSAR